MTTDGRTAPLASGERAPDFTLAAAHGDGAVSLADYRGRKAAAKLHDRKRARSGKR